eukprot:TRINITY_DN23310_c0_g1_i1.p1 TRINITY_DN23310_c0_g1~~TRINITY_DN23310_c0_g1_i1.p1  ORF type:complete len:547 (-),score=103.68 TRINITY_DN23310_c0_g1_i1:50-1690(-)
MGSAASAQLKGAAQVEEQDRSASLNTTVDGEEDGERDIRQSPKWTSPSFRQRFITVGAGSLQDAFDVDRRPCGRGGFSAVFKAVDKITGDVRAVKKVYLSDITDTAAMDQEIDIHRMMDHPNVVRLYHAFQDEKALYIVLEHCDGGELFEHISMDQRLSESQVAKLMEQIFRAMRYVHGKDVVHRDIKPENLLLETKGRLLTDNTLKLIDFGMSQLLQDEMPISRTVGTALYMAPEVGKHAGYGKPVDMWSCGVLMYMMLCGAPPFTGRNDRQIHERARSDPLKMLGPRWAPVSQPAQDLLHRLLEKDPATRCSAEQAIDCEWVRQYASFSRQLSGEGLHPELASNLHSFSVASRLRKAALIAIAQELPHDVEQCLRQSFVAMDTQGIGMLPVSEVIRVVMEMSGMPAAALEKISSQIDVSQSGVLSYTEFLAAIMDQNFVDDENLCRHAFQAFDLDNDGTISLSDLREVMKVSDSNQEQEPVSPIFKQMNRKGDGQVTFQEFKAMMKKDQAGCAVTHRTVQLQQPPSIRGRLAGLLPVARTVTPA